MLTWRMIFMLNLFMFMGCAAYTPPPLTSAHPAHPEATAAPQLPPSTTLAYESSDIPAPQPAMHMAQHNMPQQEMQHGMQQGMHGSPPGQQESPQTFVGEGKVIAVVPGSNQLVVDHGPIKGLMDAMTMGYQVEPPARLEGLKAGDNVRFTIDANKKAIVKIDKLNP
jgi:Cu/Ag efflux protein CusF